MTLRRRRAARIAVAAALVAGAFAAFARPALAQSQILVAFEAGKGVRLRDPFAQGLATPTFAEVEMTYVLGNGDHWGIGPSLGVPLGTIGLGVHTRLQAGITPGVVAYLRPSVHWAVLGRAGVPIVTSTSATLVGNTVLDVALGGEVGAAFAFFLRAGLAVVAEADATLFFGEGQEIFPILSGQVGLLAAYEVFP